MRCDTCGRDTDKNYFTDDLTILCADCAGTGQYKSGQDAMDYINEKAKGGKTMLEQLKQFKVGDKIDLVHKRKGRITGTILNIYVPENKPDDGLFDIELSNFVSGVANDWGIGEKLRVGWDFIVKLNEVK